MSTPNVSTAQKHDASQGDGRGSRILNHVLLFLEMLFWSFFVAGVGIILVFRLAYPESHVRLSRHFAFLAGSSVFTLFFSVVVSVQRLEMCGSTSRLLFHLPFLLSMSILGLTALQESSPIYAFPDIFPPAASIAFGVPIIHVILDTAYVNMTSALKGKDGAGLVFLHHLCRWIGYLISALQRRHPASTQSFEMGQHIGNVKKWFSDLVPTQHIQVWPNEESTEESKTLLSHDDQLV
ncbi:hypothetical protein HD554DRAFT_2087437 [Boletus coccyginus]|nr:hypothetical protein HD554DRAFT_2087437 [Boletus coccyginus]